MSLRGLRVLLCRPLSGGNAILSGLLDQLIILVVVSSLAQPGVEESQAQIGIESIRSRGFVPDVSNQRLKSFDVAFISGLFGLKRDCI
ncbi:MAG TPA: hypothetical protein VHF01_16030 [Candidatus Acidoferrum sp.]|nr:hypothetical protein [Candidatus Acidoferrum sp.]